MNFGADFNHPHFPSKMQNPQQRIEALSQRALELESQLPDGHRQEIQKGLTLVEFEMASLISNSPQLSLPDNLKGSHVEQLIDAVNAVRKALNLDVRKDEKELQDFVEIAKLQFILNEIGHTSPQGQMIQEKILELKKSLDCLGCTESQIEEHVNQLVRELESVLEIKLKKG